MDAKLIEPFLIYLPIPQRVVLLVIFGLLLWTWLLGISSTYFDISRVIISSDSTGLTPYSTSSKLYQNNVKLLRIIIRTILPWQLICIVVFQYCLLNNIENKLVWLLLNVSPVFELAYIFITILWTSPMIARCIKNIFWLANIEPKPYRNNYIIISDTMTSYSKPLVDLAIYMSFLFHDPANPKCQFERYQNAISLNIDVIVGIIPSLIRLVQSLREFSRARKEKGDITQLFNSIKYAGNIPIMLFTVYTRYYRVGPIRTVYWFMLWNSLYTFWWDLTMDWKLNLLNFSKRGFKNNDNKVLRNTLLYHNPIHYYCAIFTDFFLRFMWLWEYLSGGSIFYGELNIFTLQILELLRRWIWLFFKIESEYISVSEGTKMHD